MDPKTESLLPLSERHTADLVCSPSNSPTELSEPDGQLQLRQDISDYIKDPMSLEKPTGPLSDLASCPAQEAISDLNCLPSKETVSPGYGLTGGVPLSSEGALSTEAVPSVFPHQPNSSGICIFESICSTESISAPGGSVSLQSNEGSDFSVEYKSPIDSNCLIQDNRTTSVYSTIVPTPVSLKEQPSFEPVSSDHSSSTQDTTIDPLKPLSAHSNSLTEINTVTEPLPDLYIFESGTQDFILRPRQIYSFDPMSLSQDADHNTLVSMSCHCLGPREPGDPASEVSQHTAPGTPVVSACIGRLMSASDVNQDKAEVGVADRQSDSPTELWLDACQYLAGKDEGSRGDGDQATLNDPGHSLTEGGIWATFPPSEDTGVSDYLPEEDDVIGWSSGDTVGWGPPVERWSSVDSWASALSDWAAIIAAPAEDITAAFTEIGAEIDALTQALAESHVDTQQDIDRQVSPTEAEARPPQQSHLQTQTLMAIQDQALKPQPSHESSVHLGQSGLSSSLTDPTELTGLAEFQDRCGTQTEDSHLTEATPQDDKEAAEIQTPQDPCYLLPIGPQTKKLASTGHTSVLPSSAICDGLATHLSHIRGSVGEMDTDFSTSNSEEPVLLHITEDTDDGMEIEEYYYETFGDGLCQVTKEPSVSQPGPAAQQGGESGCSLGLTVSGFSRYHTGTLKVDGEGAAGSRPLTGLQGLNPVVAPPALRGSANNPKEYDQPCQDELQFNIPLAPLSIGQSLLCQTNKTSKRGDQACAKRFLNDNKGHSCYHVQLQELWPTFEEINETPLEGHEDKQVIYKEQNTVTCAEKSLTDDGKPELTIPTDLFLNNSLYDFKLHSKDTPQCFLSDKTTTNSPEIQELSRELSNLVVVPLDHFLFSEKDSVAYITLDLNDHLFLARPVTPKALRSDHSTDQPQSNPNKPSEMPHKSHKSTPECKTRCKKDKSAVLHHTGLAFKKQDNVPHHTSIQQPPKIQDIHVPVGGALTQCSSQTGHEGKENGSVNVMEPTAVAEKVPTKPQGKKKKKQSQNVAGVKSEAEPRAEEETGAKQKTSRAKTDVLEDKLSAKAGKSKDKAAGIPSKNDAAQTNSAQKKAQLPVDKARQGTQPPCDGTPNKFPPVTQLNDDVIKRRRLSENKFAKRIGAFESKIAKKDESIQAKKDEPKAGVETARKKAYSEVIKQKSQMHKEEPKVVQPIQPASVSEDPQGLCLWCQFSAVFTDYMVTWSREGTVLAEIKRSSGDESRVSVTISKASHKDLGKYRCCLSSPHGSVTLDYVLTYEVLSEIVIPASSKTLPPSPGEGEGEEEDVHCSRLLFREDFLSQQYFAENQPASIITEKLHFGEGMHRKAFRAKLQAGLVPMLSPGHACVLKVHNSISYGTNNNDDLVQKNFNLAVEECQVQNTAREYCKAYNDVAKSAESFGEVPIIIPIYLVHRPSNDIPYATLEEELIGDFVKYSVRDGKEINLMRRDSEAGQKCCAFQHWVYHKTDGNLLVTDMQGVGMKLTDVGIATSKKGYKGFRGNCATSFIDQFKALHQCNKYCELLSLTSLQPKPKRPVGTPKPKAPAPATPKKKTFGPSVKGKS